MKYPTLQKVVLTTMVLAASLALSAQAGTRNHVTSVRQTHQQTQSGHKQKPMTARAMWHDKLTATYQLDDGSAEDAVGLTLGGEEICLNEFAVIPGSETITSVEIAWGTPVFPDPSLDGLPYTVCVWSDPNGDGSPTDAVLLTTASGVVANQGTDTFITTDITPTTIETANFFVGYLIGHSAGQFPAAFDESNPIFNRSFIAGGAQGDIENLNNNELPVAPIESFGLFGNWLVRANSGEGTPTPTPTATPTPTPPGNALWYNGDFDDENGLANELNTSLGQDQFASIYDDFNVSDADGWDVTEVFSHDLADTNVTGANWEIRQGISEGNGGTLIASGTTMTPDVTNIGPGGFGFPEIEVKVTGLGVHLPFSADPYWLNVTPIGDLTGRSFDSTTSGANCVGTPCGNNENAFWNSNFFGFNWTSTESQGFPVDCSMGVNGSVSGGGGGDLELKANARKVNGTNTASLKWRGATSSDIDVFRSQQGVGGGFMLIATTPNDGSYKDSTGTTGKASFKYQVCEAGTQNCSNKTAVLFKQ